jgi:thioredoxin 1
MKTHRTLTLLATLLLLGTLTGLKAADRTKPSKPEHISRGAEVTITDYLVPGKTVIFDFTSEFCPPCRAVAPHLEKLHQSREDIVVVKVDINRPDVKRIDWDSPVAEQYRLQSVPHFKVYGPDGKLVVEGKPASKLVYSWLQ